MGGKRWGDVGLWLEFEHDWESKGRQAEVLNKCQIGPGRSSLFFCQPDMSQALTKWQAFHRSHGPLYEAAKIAKDMPEWSVLWPQLGAEKLRGRWSAWVHGNDVRAQSETHVTFEWDNEEGVHDISAGEIQATLFIYSSLATYWMWNNVSAPLSPLSSQYGKHYFTLSCVYTLWAERTWRGCMSGHRRWCRDGGVGGRAVSAWTRPLGLGALLVCLSDVSFAVLRRSSWATASRARPD